MAGRVDSFGTKVGAISVSIDYATPRFYVEVPEVAPARDFVRALRLVADLGFEMCDVRNYEPEVVSGATRIELERTVCR